MKVQKCKRAKEGMRKMKSRESGMQESGKAVEWESGKRGMHKL